MLLTDPVVLENAFVRLEPLDASHAADLDEARRGLDYAWYTSVPASAADEIAHRLNYSAEWGLEEEMQIADERGAQ